MNIHFIGIGGIGTSSIAQILHKKGNKISGSDSTPSDLTKDLKLSGIKISIGHNSKNVTKKHDLVIYSPAIPNSNSEFKKAKQLKIKIQSYPQALGELTKEYFTVAVAGTHGKSTTTAMIALIAQKAGLDPNVVIGTKIREFKNKNFRVGKSNLLILEACEYKRSFLHINPDILVITNIEAEHLDYYKNLADYKKAFAQLAKKAKKVIRKPDKIKIKPKLPGKFNITNAQFAATTCRLLNIDEKTIKQIIQNFSGTWRRLEFKKTKLKTKFIDDYAHHPTEIKMTLTAIREQFPEDKILLIYQPHQYSRTRILLKKFGKSFHDADQVIIPNIYKVRDTKKDIKGTSPQALVNEINKTTPNKAKNGHSLKKTADFIRKNHKDYDLIITMGAGDIDRIYKMI